MINKGFISALYESGAKATVVPAFALGTVTAELVVPDNLAGTLTVGMAVVYAAFPDGTGLILARMDGVTGPPEQGGGNDGDNGEME